jgi:hypothetical protein
MPSGESLCRLRIKRCHPEERSDEESALLFHAPTLLALLALRLRRAFSGAPPFLKGGSCLCVAQGARRCCGALGLSRSFVFVVIPRSIAARNLLFLFAFNVAPACPEPSKGLQPGILLSRANPRLSPPRLPPRIETSCHSERSVPTFLLPEIVSSRFPSSGESHQQDVDPAKPQSSTRSRRIPLAGLGALQSFKTKGN